MSALPVLFIQRDGALLRGSAPPTRVADFDLVPGVIAALARLSRQGYRSVLVGQPGGPAPDAALLAQLEKLCTSQGVALLPGCHGPLPATASSPSTVELLAEFLQHHRCAIARSATIGGDAMQPVARFLGIRPLPLSAAAPDWPGVVEALTATPRRARVQRTTGETDITVEVNLDRNGPQRIATGLGFFDHMLEQLGKHGGFALDVQCRGDLHIDEHHTVEDCALALGSALNQALGERRGIARFGFLLPMDETRAQVAVDLGGRPFCVFEAAFPRDRVGGLATEMVPHFYRSVAETLRANIHVQITGENTHHMVEASFKGVGRALRQALVREGDSVPSTKGRL